ncbi:MAG TPA: sulfur reduction protein DsrJ [Gammaproteobacteria bacterium]|nr:sulfur reduction protein DsrJ [Gammaproteobacteria bacterium]
MKSLHHNNKYIAALLAVMLLALALPALAETPLPVIPKGKGEKCVQPTDVMRARHFEFILDQRDATMHEGIRTPQYSLAQCINCHVPKAQPGQERVRYGSDEHFCSACHNYAAVTIDCFECHNDGPTGEALNLTAKEGEAVAVEAPVDLMHEAVRLAKTREVK